MKKAKIRSKKAFKLIVVSLQLLIIICLLFVGCEFTLKKEVIIITTEVSERFSKVIIDKNISQEEDMKIVYDGMTSEELSNKLNKSLKGILTNRGNTFAKYSIQYGIDPYLATAIVLHETGCKWNCSYLATHCNNIGGQKGYPSCGGGEYMRFATIDDGIKAFFDNLYYNYYQYGLKDVYSIHKKYAEDPSWSYYINNYISEIKSE